MSFKETKEGQTYYCTACEEKAKAESIGTATYTEKPSLRFTQIKL